MVDGNKLNSVLVTYLGSTIQVMDALTTKYRGGWPRLVHLSADYARDLQPPCVHAKGKIYRAIVLSTLLYGAEAWTVYRRQVKKLHALLRHLRSI